MYNPFLVKIRNVADALYACSHNTEKAMYDLSWSGISIRESNDSTRARRLNYNTCCNSPTLRSRSYKIPSQWVSSANTLQLLQDPWMLAWNLAIKSADFQAWSGWKNSKNFLSVGVKIARFRAFPGWKLEIGLNWGALSLGYKKGNWRLKRR